MSFFYHTQFVSGIQLNVVCKNISFIFSQDLKAKVLNRLLYSHYNVNKHELKAKKKKNSPSQEFDPMQFTL